MIFSTKSLIFICLAHKDSVKVGTKTTKTTLVDMIQKQRQDKPLYLT